MKIGLLVISLLVLAAALPAFACDINGETGIAEKNDLWIAADSKAVYTVTEERFNAILDRIEELYSPIIEARGKRLQVVRNWDDGTVNAYAQQQGSLWKISMFGGLARHETITEDAFALVACHELGHHIGGAPKKSSWFGGSSWASNEGQSDYWGNMKCMRRYMEMDDNVAVVAEMEVDDFVRTRCEELFEDAETAAMCMRGGMAGLSLGNLFRALRRLDTRLHFSTPDPGRVSQTNHNHPAPQCRLDTYWAGAVCEKSYDDVVSRRDAAQGVCTRAEGQYTDQVRPLCWYKAPTI